MTCDPKIAMSHGKVILRTLLGFCPKIAQYSTLDHQRVKVPTQFSEGSPTLEPHVKNPFRPALTHMLFISSSVEE